jgi:serine/threonine-protein kinase
VETISIADEVARSLATNEYLRAGTTLGVYELVKPLGRGGMGTVYEAVHSTIGRKVAVKVLHKEFTENKISLRRFFDEARSVNRIEHEAIIQITDLVEDDPPFIVMELLKGETLEQRLDDGRRLSLPELRRMIDSLAGCLEVAHQNGIIHRDLKPANIFLLGDEDNITGVKLLDFGIAKLIRAPEEQADIAQSVAGKVVGTPTYMSPEQIACRELDHRTDIYSLGVLVYEALVGKPPFRGEAFADFLVAHLSTDPVPPGEREPSVSPALNAFVLSLLAKEPDARPQTGLPPRRGGGGRHLPRVVQLRGPGRSLRARVGLYPGRRPRLRRGDRRGPRQDASPRHPRRSRAPREGPPPAGGSRERHGRRAEGGRRSAHRDPQARAALT